MKNLYLILTFLFPLQLISSESLFLFHQNDSIYIVNGSFKIISELEYHPYATLSPDNKKLFYVKTNGDWSRVFCFQNLETGYVFESKLYKDMSIIENPTWSPQSNVVIYTTAYSADSGITRLLEGYDFSKEQLFRIDINHLPFFSSLCGWTHDNTIIFYNDTKLYELEYSTRKIVKKIDLFHVFNSSKSYTKLELGDTTYISTNNLDKIFNPQVEDIGLLQNPNQLYIVSKNPSPESNFVYDQKYFFNANRNSLYFCDLITNSITQLSPDTISVENIQKISGHEVIFNGFTAKDILFVTKDTSSYTHTISGKKYRFNINKHTYFFDTIKNNIDLINIDILNRQ